MTPRMIWRESWRVARVAARNSQRPDTVCDHPDIRTTVPRAVHRLEHRLTADPYYRCQHGTRNRRRMLEVASARVLRTPEYRRLLTRAIRAVYFDPCNPYRYR